MSTSFQDVEYVVRTIAQTAVDNEKHFGDLDAVVGDGDFGYSLARGFEIVLQDWDTYDRTDIGTFLKKIAVVITSRIGGTSGPIWGTAFLRAGAKANGKTELSGDDVVVMLRACAEGISARGKAVLGEKTLLDALIPANPPRPRRRSRRNAAGPATPANAASVRWTPGPWPWPRSPSKSPRAGRTEPADPRWSRPHRSLPVRAPGGEVPHLLSARPTHRRGGSP